MQACLHVAALKFQHDAWSLNRQVLRRISEEPEEFTFRSLNLVDDEPGRPGLRGIGVEREEADGSVISDMGSGCCWKRCSVCKATARFRDNLGSNEEAQQFLEELGCAGRLGFVMALA